MTYDEAVATLKVRYNAGERLIEVSPEVYLAYASGTTALFRETAEPRPVERPWLAFKCARVWKEGWQPCA